MLSSNSDLISSIINVASILCTFLSTSCCAQHHIIERIFCSPLERICFASFSPIRIFTSALCGPLVVVFLTRSFCSFSTRTSYNSLSESHPEENSIAILFKYSMVWQLLRVLSILLNSTKD